MPVLRRPEFWKLKLKLVEKGMSQPELAKAIGVSEFTIKSRLRGESPFKVDEVEAICRVLGIDDPAEAWQIFFAKDVR